MMARQLLDHYEDSIVTANGVEIWASPEIPTGQTWHLIRFGGAAIDSALIALQIRTGTNPDTWQTLRAVMPRGQGEFTVNRQYVGDGVAKFRIVRQEKSGNAQAIVAWIEGYRLT
jgi:hypothetical protein